MKVVLKAVALLAMASIVAGFTYAHFRAEDHKYETVVLHEKVKSGDTFNGVIAEYYNSDNEKECWDEWSAVQRARNKMLFKKQDGSTRFLQAGDIICIEVRQRIK